MLQRFPANEVFEMAIRAEQNGAAFYRKAAEVLEEKSSVAFLTELAVMEDDHEKVFSGMRKNLSEMEQKDTVFDPHDEASLYLAAASDAHGGEGSPAVAATLTGDETLEQILRIAIKLEQKSILFYLGLRDLVPEQLGKDRVDAIIEEEKKHVAGLVRQLQSTTKKA